MLKNNRETGISCKFLNVIRFRVYNRIASIVRLLALLNLHIKREYLSQILHKCLRKCSFYFDSYSANHVGQVNKSD